MKGLKHPLVLLLAVSSLASCRLVDDFTANNNNGGCRQFFLNGRSPTVLQNNNNRYQQICQVYMNKDRFATLYDTKNKIPVYSAYLHIPHEKIIRMDEWWTEPGLRIAHQASNRDYAGSGYHRGHLYPVYNNNDPEGADATFTLTNAAPQDPTFNIRWFSDVEQKVNQNCGGNRGYIVTGVVPDPNHIIGNGVSVASHFWTAYCCLNNNGKPIARGAYLMHRTGVLVLDNDPDLQNLDNRLTTAYDQTFRVFGNQC